MLQQAVERIRQMEQCFDSLLETQRTNPAAFQTDAGVRKMLQTLIQYYQGGQWLADYHLDEQGLLPPELKRGVLSQDGVSDFLDRIRDALSPERSEIF